MINQPEWESAPVGSWITWNSEFAYSLQRTPEGWMLHRRGKLVNMVGPRDLTTYVREVFHLHVPAPVKIRQWHDGPTPYYTRYCRRCGDFEIFEANSAAAHDDARDHAKEHAQEKVA